MAIADIPTTFNCVNEQKYKKGAFRQKPIWCYLLSYISRKFRTFRAQNLESVKISIKIKNF